MRKHRLRLSVAAMSLMIAFCARAQTVTIGSGTTQNGATATSPINNDYDSHHCQILYTAAEINAGGLTAAGTITQLGFYVTVAPANALPNYTIKMKNTSAISAATYDGAGLTQVHNIASYTPGTGGFQMLTLNTPFVWDGVSNLLVDVCFDLAAGNGGSGRCRIFTPSPAGTHYSYTRNDGFAQCGIPTNADDGNFNDFGTKATKPQLRFVYTAPPACVPATMMPVTGIMSNGATISWAAPNPAPAGGYAWEVVAAGTGTAGTAVASGSVAPGTTSVSVTGLTDNTAYDVYLVSYCGGTSFSTYSGPVTFTTLCSATNIPYAVNMASATPPALPTCVSGEKLNAANDWITVNAPSYGFNNNTMTYIYNSSLPANAWFYTQGLNLTAGTSYRLTYKYANDGGTTYPEKMNVNYGTSPLAAAMTSTLADHPNISGATAPLISIVDFVPPSTGVYYIGFHAYSDLNEDILMVDSIHVDLSPSCIEPPNVNASAITASSANISWTAPGGSPANYNWEVLSSGMPGTGSATASGTVAASTTSVSATGLSANTTYSAYVRTDCGSGNFSSWSLVHVFTTPCMPTNVPYMMDIANAVTPNIPTCTSIENLNSGNDWYTDYQPGGVTGFNNNALVYSYNSNLPGDAWIYSQGLNLTAGVSYRLSYKYSNDGGTSYPEKMNVNYGMSPAATAMTFTLADHPNISGVTQPLIDVIDFTPSATGVYYIGFHAYSDADMDLLIVDSVLVDVTPSCVSPSTISVTNITATSADVNWSTPSIGPPASYSWEIRTSGTPGTAGAAASGTLAAPGTSVTASGLAPGTVYYAYVRTDCGAGGFSTWSPAVAFTTPCLPTNVPYTMDLVNVTAPALPTCITAQTLNSGNIWETVNAPGYGFNGNAMVYSWNSTLPADTWFYTQGLNLTGGVAYKLSYRYNAAGTTFVENLNVNYGTSPVASAMTNTLTDHMSIANAANPYVDVVSFTPASTGVYYIGFHAYSDPDQFDLFVDSVHVDLCVAPTVSVAASSNTICSSQSATLTASGAASYMWSTSATTSTISVSPTASTTYTVMGTDVCGTGTTTAMITVNSATAVAASASSTLLCSGGSAVLNGSGATSYTWTAGSPTGTVVANTSTVSVSPGSTTTYYLAGDNSGCPGSSSVTINVTVCTGIPGTYAPTITLYPNPVNDVLMVDIPTALAADNAFIDVYDAVGKMVIQQGLDTISTTVNTSRLEPGIYIYKIHNNNANVQIGKIVKQ